MRTTPYSEGDLSSATVCFVAEAPARWEMQRQRPLVGESGHVFEECLHAAGIVRSQCYIANVVRGRIDSVGEYLTDTGLTEKGRAAQADLQSRLATLRANVIVPLGNLALACTTSEYGRGRGISRLRGSIYRGLLGKKVIPTYHPASTLPGRGPYVNRYVITADMRKAVRESASLDLVRTNRTYIIRPSFELALDFLNSLNDADHFSWDIEISNFQISCIGFAPSPHIGICVPFTLGTQHYWTEEQEVHLWQAISTVLGNPAVEKRTHYGGFDESFILRNNKIRVYGRRNDTLVAHRILYPDLPSKLEFLCSMFTDIPYYKDDKKLWNRIDKDPDRFFRYNINDVFSTDESWEKMAPLLEEDEAYSWTYRNTMSMWEPCLFAAERGVRLDLNSLEEERERVRRDIVEKEANLKAVSEVEFDPASAVQCLKYFYVIKGLPPYLNPKTHKPTCDDKALSRIVRKYNLPEARILQELRSLYKLRDAYLDLKVDTDQRMRCFYDIRGTTTGRFSSKKTVTGTGLNMQNIDPRFLRFIKPG